MYIGAFLMLGELLAPGFVIFFFGLSAATVGACRFAFGEAFTATWQLAAFSAFSILCKELEIIFQQIFYFCILINITLQ